MTRLVICEKPLSDVWLVTRGLVSDCLDCFVLTILLGEKYWVSLVKKEADKQRFCSTNRPGMHSAGCQTWMETGRRVGFNSNLAEEWRVKNVGNQRGGIRRNRRFESGMNPVCFLEASWACCKRIFHNSRKENRILSPLMMTTSPLCAPHRIWLARADVMMTRKVSLISRHL